MAQTLNSRLVPVPRIDWTEVQSDLAARFGFADRTDPLFDTLLHAPDVVAGALPMTRYVQDSSTLASDHRLVLGLRTAWLEDSAGVWATYAGEASRHPELVAVSVGQAEANDPLVPSLLQLADQLVANSSVNDETWAGLAQGHDVHWLMDAVETVAHVSFMSGLARSFGVGTRGGDLAPIPNSSQRPVERRPPTLVTHARISPIEGTEIAVLRTFARHPAMNTARRPRSNFINRVSPLTPHDRETLILRIGWDCQSEYEWAKHVGSVGRSRDHGVDPYRVAAGPSAPDVTAADAMLMRVADDLYQDSMVSDATWAALTEHYDLTHAMSAVFTASSYRSTSMSLNAYGVELEPGDERFPPRTS